MHICSGNVITRPKLIYLGSQWVFMPAGNVTSKLKKRIKYKANLQAVHFGIFSNFPIAAMLTSSTLSESLLCEYTLWTLSTPNQQSI